MDLVSSLAQPASENAEKKISWIIRASYNTLSVQNAVLLRWCNDESLLPIYLLFQHKPPGGQETNTRDILLKLRATYGQSSARFSATSSNRNRTLICVSSSKGTTASPEPSPLDSGLLAS